MDRPIFKANMVRIAALDNEGLNPKPGDVVHIYHSVNSNTGDSDFHITSHPLLRTVREDNRIQTPCGTATVVSRFKNTDYWWCDRIESVGILINHVSEAMRQNGSKKTPAQQAARSGNAATARAAIVRELAPCSCGSDPHKPGCPVYVRERTARSRARKANMNP